MALFTVLAELIFSSSACSILNGTTFSFIVLSDESNWVISGEYPNGRFAVQTYGGKSWYKANIPGAIWIWDRSYALDNSLVTFKLQFQIPGTLTYANLRIASDDGFSIAANGVNTGIYSSTSSSSANLNFNMYSFLKSGENTLDIQVYNGGGPGGLIYKLSISSVIQ